MNLVKRISIVVALLAGVLAQAQQTRTVVTQVSPGWKFKTYAPSGQATATWQVCAWKGVPSASGNGSLWMYTGDSNGIAYAETSLYHGLPVSELNSLSFSTYTGEGLGNVCPLLGISIDVTGDGKGDAWLLYDANLDNKRIPANTWSSWNVLGGKLWCNKKGAADLRTLGQWLAYYGQDARVDSIRLQAGTWDASVARAWSQRWLGADCLVVGARDTSTQYDFEPAVASIEEPVALSFPQQGGQVQGTQGVAAGADNNIKGVEPSPAGAPMAPPITDPRYFVYHDAIQGNPNKLESPWLKGDFAYVPVLFQGTHNMRVFLSTNTATDMGTANNVDRDPAFTNGGSFLLGGVPFHFDKAYQNIWNAYECPGEGPHTLSMTTNLRGAVEVFTVFNTLGGVRTPGLVTIEFFGDKGAHYSVDMAGDKDFRDWHEGPFTNVVKDNSTQVWWKAKARLDRQSFVLPDAFADQTLTKVVLTDRGKRGQQKVVLFGVTVKALAGKLK